MVFTGGASAGVKAAATAGKNSLRGAAKGVARKTLMTSMKTTLKNAGQSYMWRNLKSNMKDHFKSIPEEIGNYVMEEALAISSVQEATQEFDAGAMAWDIGELVDPTGITTFVRYLVEGQEECKYPEGPTDQDQADLVAASGSNYEASCGSTPHGGSETRRRFQYTEHSSCNAQTQSRTCRHGCCKSFWSCGGNQKHCETWTYGGWQYAAEAEKAIADKAQTVIAAKEDTEQKSMTQSVVSEKSSTYEVAVMGFAFIGLASIFSFAYKRVVPGEYKHIIEPEI